MDEEQLAELEALERSATPGPWVYDDYDLDSHAAGLPHGQQWIAQFGMAKECDGDLCAALRNAAPALLAEVRALRKALRDALRQTWSKTATTPSGKWECSCCGTFEGEPHKPGCPFALLNEDTADE